jgi:hypothetical protein
MWPEVDVRSVTRFKKIKFLTDEELATKGQNPKFLVSQNKVKQADSKYRQNATKCTSADELRATFQ